jgi:hypothetical protein
MMKKVRAVIEEGRGEETEEIEGTETTGMAGLETAIVGPIEAGTWPTEVCSLLTAPRLPKKKPTLFLFALNLFLFFSRAV